MLDAEAGAYEVRALSRILVLGGYGGFGARLTLRLLGRGYSVLVAGRNLDKATAFCARQSNAEPIVADRNGDLGPVLAKHLPRSCDRRRRPLSGKRLSRSPGVREGADTVPRSCRCAELCRWHRGVECGGDCRWRRRGRRCLECSGTVRRGCASACHWAGSNFCRRDVDQRVKTRHRRGIGHRRDPELCRSANSALARASMGSWFWLAGASPRELFAERRHRLAGPLVGACGCPRPRPDAGQLAGPSGGDFSRRNGVRHRRPSGFGR